MLNIDVIYILANALLLISFIITGRNAHNETNYKRFAIISIIIYTFVLGLRYERGNDYIHYANMYQYGFSQGEQKAFVLLNDVLHYLGVGKYYIFVIYSFIEILCSFIFLSRYKLFGVYIVPFFMISTISFNEYAIRQALGFSFAFLYFDCLFEINKSKIPVREIATSLRKIIQALLFLLLSYSIHTACGYLLVTVTIMYFIYKKPIPLYFSIPLFLFTTFFFKSISDISWIRPLLSLLEGDDRMSLYINDETRFETNDSDIKIYTRNSIVLLFEMIGTISLYYFGFKAIRNWYHKQEYYFLYNLFVIGTLLLNAFRTYEMLQRIGQNLYLFWFFPLSIVLYHHKEIVRSSSERILFCFLTWWGYDYMKYLFYRGEMTKFIWDI